MRMVENYPEIEAKTHEEFLEKLLSMEVEAREINRKNSLIKNAKFDVFKTFEDYTFEDIEISQSISIEEIKTASFIDKKDNLILYGPVGTGKTHLATAIGIEACNRGKKVKFFRTAALVNQLIDAKKNEELKKFLKQISNTDLLICDEWGYIPFEKEGSRILFQVISECYEKRSLIVTTNLEFSKWNGIFFDEKLTSAIIDRIVHHGHLLIFNGSSYRLKHSSING
jgi:DNA replication protein DnaC